MTAPEILVPAGVALFRAFRSDDPAAALQGLASSGLDMTALDDWGSSAMIYAVEEPTVLAALIACGVPVNQRCGDNRTALHRAAELGRARSVEMLLEAGANPDLQTRIGGQTALHLALPHPATVAVLVRAGASLTIPDIWDAPVSRYLQYPRFAAAATVVRFIEHERALSRQIQTPHPQNRARL